MNHQVLKTDIERIVWQSVGRIHILILGMNGFTMIVRERLYNIVPS